jgi:hypothetical protein
VTLTVWYDDDDTSRKSYPLVVPLGYLGLLAL